MAFERVKDALRIQGYTGPDYLELLYTAARDTDVEGGTLEIGCFLGRSTAVICRALQDRNLGEALFVIDSFSAPEEDPDLKRELSRIHKPDELFQKNMGAMGVANFNLMVGSSHDDRAWDTVPDKIRFAHVDGDHSYEGVREDLERVIPRLSNGAVVALDDYHDRMWDWGVKRAVNELLMPVSRKTWSTKTGEQILVEVRA